MSIGQTLRWIYGLTMGTSTPLLKAKRSRRQVTRIRLSGEYNGSVVEATVDLGDVANSAVLGNWHFMHAGPVDGQNRFVILTPWSDSLTQLIPNRLTPKEPGDSQKSLPHPFYSAVGLKPEWRALWDSFGIQTLETVEQETVITDASVGVIRLIPFTAAHTGGDLVAICESVQLILLGALYSADVHPMVDPLGPVSVQGWIEALVQIRNQAQALNLSTGRPVWLVGDIGQAAQFDQKSGRDPIQNFIDYLRDLSDPNQPFSRLREKYDWPEFIGQSSLEENFDLLKRRRNP